MKRLLGWMLLPALLLSLLAGCSHEAEPTTGRTSTTATAATVAAEEAFSYANTYWIAYEYFDEEHNQMRTTESAGWYMDLFILEDGTARFRDIYNQLCIMDDDGLHLQWMADDSGTLEMYNAAYDDPLLKGGMEADVLTLSYRDTPISLKQAPMPQEVGELYSPAELTGTWMAVSGENEGYTWELFPPSFETLVFYTDAEQMTLVADMECRGYLGSPMENYRKLPLEVLEQELYPGCANEKWSIRLGPNGEGQPDGKEVYVTLLGRNTLLLQNYFSIDGAPAVSHVTYLRVTPALSWWNVTTEEVENTNWYCASYLNAEGKQLDIPEQFRDMLLQLGSDGVCMLGQEQGTWVMAGGGAVALYSAEDVHEIYGYGGAVRASYAGGDSPFYEMYLYYEGGLLRFLIDSYG